MMWFLLLCSIAMADEVVTIEQGDPAPFTGTLLSPPAAARLLANSDRELELCRINSTRDLALAEAREEREVAIAKAETTACQFKFDETQLLYEQHIEFLERQAKRPNWETPASFIGGVVVGVAVVTLSAWTLNQIEEH